MRLDGYRFDRRIGVGGTSEVWLAWTEGVGARPVAIKLITPHSEQAAAAIWAEAAILAGVDHPGVLAVVELRSDARGGGHALVTELVPGGSLRQLLDERGALGPGAVVALLTAIADALDALHRHGIVHGDLKPENVLLDADGSPVVADVASAREATPEYLDPAVLAGTPLDEPADAYALAVIAYEALTGRRPHRGDAAEALAAAAVGARRPLGTWPTVPADLAAVVEAALDPDRRRRPPDLGSFVSALAGCVDRSELVLPGPASAAFVAGSPPSGATTTLRFGPAPPQPPARRGRHGWFGRTIGAVRHARRGADRDRGSWR